MSGHAELAQVWPRDGALRLVGRLHDHEPEPATAAAWTLRLTPRGAAGERALCYPAPLDGMAFDASLPVADLVPEGPFEPPALWDVWLAPPEDSGAGLRVGRLLDDIRGKKKIMVFPGQQVTRGDLTMLVRPYYTIKENLSVEVLPGR
ncbi:hypothetical protein [Streptomyces millisiae]|uniref:Uncharacterized protein n=1 Tax=Streptomyces millisiae TaxID=3075542 RepID=A0ABU2LMS3_9ACTN|nr:hypothetical protein [Streptomyces sp. DSM 44918]MDT0318900.1 hypothetical protein [Streptomyces sp. DSM 44918]